MACERAVPFRKQRSTRLSVATLSGRRGACPEPPLAMKVTEAATKTSAIQETRFVEPNAHDGLREWRVQLLTAIAVIPLSLYFATFPGWKLMNETSRMHFEWKHHDGECR